MVCIKVVHIHNGILLSFKEEKNYHTERGGREREKGDCEKKKWKERGSWEQERGKGYMWHSIAIFSKLQHSF